MTYSGYETFANEPYPCYWLGPDGGLWRNAAAQASVREADIDRLVLPLMRAVAAEYSTGQTSGAVVAPLPGPLLERPSLTVFPLGEGLMGVTSTGSRYKPAELGAQFREPLTNIFAMLPLLGRKLGEKDWSYLDSVENNCYTLLRLTRNLECLGVLEKPVTAATVDLAALVEALCTSAETVSREQNIPFDIDLPPYPVLVRGDKDLLSEAILNILRNSIQFTRDGNRVSLRLYVAAGRAVLTIEDRGLGIRGENLPHIFDAYFSADPYGDDDGAPGMGLGLAIVKGAARSFGGTVAVESRYSEGTSVTMALPLDKSVPGAVLGSEPADYLLDRYSTVYVQLCGYCRYPSAL